MRFLIRFEIRMGSSGSSRFSDYPDSPRSKVTSGSGRSGSAGGDSGEDRCEKAFSVTLEDYERSEYYESHGEPPKIGTVVTIDHGKRIVARVGGESIGNVPTAFNYLAACIKAGFSYRGRITAVAGIAVVKITIDVGPKL